MRIALLSWESKHSIAVGGLAEHVTELSSALATRGHNVHVFTRVGEYQEPYEFIEGVHYHRCAYYHDPDFMTDVNRMCESFAWHVVEVEHRDNRPFDIIHGHDWLVVRALAQLKNLHGRPVVFTMHSTEYGRCGNQLCEGPSRRIRELEWEGLFVSSRVICVSSALGHEIRHLYSTPADKMHIIHNGVDVRRFDAEFDVAKTRRRYGVGVDDPMVLFAGRMTWQKGPDLLVEAAPPLVDRHPHTKVVFAGDGDMRFGLERRASSLGMSDATRFLGQRNGRDLVGLFKSSDVVCVPSRNEPFGIVILEAWSAGKPVVATPNGGPAEFLKHEDTGLIVADDRDAIAHGLDTLLSDKSGAERMGRKGRREAEQRFSWTTVAADTELVYRSALPDTAHAATPTISSTLEEPAMARARTEKGKANAGTKPARGKTKTTKAQSATTEPTKAADGVRLVKQMTRPAAQVTGGMQPTELEIRQRAYEIYLARHSAEGDPTADWLQAEEELKAERGLA